MTAWTPDELERIGDAEEPQLNSRRSDGGMSSCVTMWVVRSGQDLCVRSAGEPDRPWYRRARTSGSGRVRAGGIDRDVTFDDADPAQHAGIDAAYHAKYDRYRATIVGHVTGPDARAVTIRLVPAAPRTETEHQR